MIETEFANERESQIRTNYIIIIIILFSYRGRLTKKTSIFENILLFSKFLMLQKAKQFWYASPLAYSQYHRDLFSG